MIKIIIIVVIIVIIAIIDYYKVIEYWINLNWNYLNLLRHFISYLTF